MPGFLRKCYTTDTWQDSEDPLGSEYGSVLNMPGLHKVLKRRSIIDTWQGSDCASSFLNGRVTESCEFCVNCIWEIHGILNIP